MQSTQVFSTTDIFRRLGISPDTQKRWLRERILFAGGGRRRCRGADHQFTFCQFVAVGLIKSLRRRGAPIMLCRALGSFLCGLSTDELESAARRGMLLVASATGIVSPQFIAPEARIRSEFGREGLSDLFFAVEARVLWEKGQRASDALNEEAVLC